MSVEAAARLEALLKERMDPDSRRNKFSIEIDCPPGNPRPNNLFPSVLDGTGLNVEDFDLVSRFFGNFMWILKESAGKDEVFTAAKPILRDKLSILWKKRVIRYASW